MSSLTLPVLGVMLVIVIRCALTSSDDSNHPQPYGACKDGSLCNTINDDLTGEYTNLETEDAEMGTENPEERHLRRQRRSDGSPLQEALEKDFQFTDDKQYFYDLLDGVPPHDKALFHKQSPNGYSETDRTKLLLFDIQKTWYPPFTYRGLYGRSSWQSIPIETLMKKRNKSFMMLEHACEQEATREDEKKCAKQEYPKLPRCNSEADQSPIDINTFKARDSSLKEFLFTNIKDSQGKPIKFPFMMSVPWDGTDILSVELLGNQPPPSVEKGSISGRKLHLERIHIHFGENETVGSEHTLNNLTYSMELQFIFTMRKRDDGVREPTDLQYWDLLMEYYTTAGKPNRHKNVHIIAFWVKVIEDEKFKSGRGDWNDAWNKEASNAFGTLARAARKFWAIHNTLQQPDATASSPASNVTPPGTPMPSTTPTPPPAGRKRRQVSNNTTSATINPPIASPTNSTRPPAPSRPFKYRAVISTGTEELELGAFFPPQVMDTRQNKQRDSIYYNYKGGITHPPCFAFVEWDIYDRPLYIPTSMWLNFLYMHSEFDDTKYIAGNYRMPRHVYIEALDSKKTESWTSKNEEERQKVLAKMDKRDLRRSKPTGSESENYDYDDTRNGSRSVVFSSDAFLAMAAILIRIMHRAIFNS